MSQDKDNFLINYLSKPFVLQYTRTTCLSRGDHSVIPDIILVQMELSIGESSTVQEEMRLEMSK